MCVEQPSATLVAWGNAWLTGHIGPDETADAVERIAGPHVVVGVPGESGEVPLRRGLGSLRLAGMTSVRLALPAAGDPLGLSGPVAFNTAAIEAGEAVLAIFPDRQLGLVPAEDRRGSSYVGIRWGTYEAQVGAPDVPALPEADHRLTVAVQEATETLLTLDGVAAWRPEIAEALTALRESHHHGPERGLTPGYPPRAHRVAALAGRLAIVVDLAHQVDGQGLTAEQTRRRSEALRTLDHAVRRARVAAYNSVLDPVR